MSEFRTAGRRAIEHVRDGMGVYAANGEHLGEVQYVDLGDPESATAEADGVQDVFRYGAAAINDAAGEPQVPEPGRTRLRRSGFIKIDGPGLLDADCYAAAHDIASVDRDRVTLAIGKEHLLQENRWL